MSDEHVHRAVPSLRKEEDLSERFPRTMPTHITDTCRCGATRQKRVSLQFFPRRNRLRWVTRRSGWCVSLTVATRAEGKP